MFFLYIDPATGSMLFTILLGLISGIVYFFRNLFVKLKFSVAKDASLLHVDKKDLVIFLDDKRYWNIFEPICDELEKRQITSYYWTASPDDLARTKDYKYIHVECFDSTSKAIQRMNFLDARIVLSTTPSLDVFQWKRSKTVDYYVHIPHAASDISMYRMFGIDYYDAILLSGQYQKEQVRQLEKIRDLPAKEVAFVGIPYMDVMAKRVRTADKVATSNSNDKTILLAPSWGPNSILNKYGSKALQALINTGYHVIVRPHPQSFTAEKEMLEHLMEEFPNKESFEWNRDSDNFDVLHRSDILISDFSGVIFDFALIFDKPVMYADTSFDPSPYDCWWLEDEAWTFRALPQLGKAFVESDFHNLKEIIDHCFLDPTYKEARDALRQETWLHPGEGAVRVADYLEEKLQSQHEESLRPRKEEVNA